MDTMFATSTGQDVDSRADRIESIESELRYAQQKLSRSKADASLTLWGTLSLNVTMFVVSAIATVIGVTGINLYPSTIVSTYGAILATICGLLAIIALVRIADSAIDYRHAPARVLSQTLTVMQLTEALAQARLSDGASAVDDDHLKRLADVATPDEQPDVDRAIKLMRTMETRLR